MAIQARIQIPNPNGVMLQGNVPGTPQQGSINVSGTVTAGFFSGDGSALVNLPLAPFEEGVVGSATIDLSVGTKQAIFTVPAGRKSVPTKVVLSGASAAILAGTRIQFGFNATADDVFGNDMHNELVLTENYKIIDPSIPAKRGQPADVFGAVVTVTQAATTVRVDVVGFYI